VKRFFAKDDVTVVAFIDKDEDSDLLENLKEAAEATREEFKAVGYTTSKEVAAHFKVTPSAITVWQPERLRSKFEPKFKSLEKSTASKEDILAFMRDNAIPLVGHRTQANQGSRFSKKPLVVVYYSVDFSHEHIKETQIWREKVLKVANKHKDKFTFAISDEEEFKKEMEEVGLGDSGAEINVVCFGKDGRKYPWLQEDDEFSEEAFEEYMEKLNTGRVKAYIKSQPPPKDDKGPVKTVVASTFDKIVKDLSKDVMIEFYAPWCGHCKQLEPIYKDLAKKLKSETNLVIAKMDATVNDAPEGYGVEGFPTIYFAPAGKKDTPLKYNGGRDVASMEKFIKENAVASFKKSEL
jgi:protein disulfide-isomerase A4